MNRRREMLQMWFEIAPGKLELVILAGYPLELLDPRFRLRALEAGGLLSLEG